MVELFLSSVGLVTLFLVFLNVFTKYGDKTAKPNLKIPLSLSDAENFQNTLASAINSSVDIGQAVTILTDGREFLEDLLIEIQKAKESIYLTNFICEDGEFSSAIMDALAEKAKQGIAVRVLLDSVGSVKMSTETIEKLQQCKGKVAFFRPITWWNMDRINRRTHIRDCVIDGETVYLGGIAISDLWLSDGSSPKNWHDFMYKTSGEMARRGYSIFCSLWTQTTGEYLVPLKPLKTHQKKGVNQFISLFSVPTPDLSSNLENFVWLSLQAAQKSIHIQNPYLLPSDNILKALRQKAKEGIEVSIIVPGKNTDTVHTRWATHTFYSTLLEAGVKIYEYQPSRTHSKVMIIDKKWSVIGSANLDNRSSKINLEWIVGIYDKKYGKLLEDKFQTDIKKSLRITKSRWSKTGYLVVPVRYFFSLFSQLY